jgi:hypothetical protein
MARLEINFPETLIQLCETHPDREYTVQRALDRGWRVAGQVAPADAQDQLPKWGLQTSTLSPRHPLAAWLWLHDPIYRVSPGPLRQRMYLDAVTEWQQRCGSLEFPRIFSRKKALEGFGTQRPDSSQAKAVLYAMERYLHDEPTLWILWNDEDKKVEFLDEKAFPKADGYKHIWILREPKWDKLWDASKWSNLDLVQWIQSQEKAGFKVAWPVEPSTATQKGLAAEYEKMGFSAGGLSKDELRHKVGRGKAIASLTLSGIVDE